MESFDELKSIATTLKEADKIEQYRQILETQEKLLDMQKRIIALESENQELNNELQTNKNLVFKDSAYWLKNDNELDGPLCSCCWDDNKKIIRMQPCGNKSYYDCPKCNNKSVQIYPDNANHYHEPENFDPYSTI